MRPAIALAVILQQCLRFLLKNLQQFGGGIFVICSRGMLVFSAFDEEAQSRYCLSSGRMARLTGLAAAEVSQQMSVYFFDLKAAGIVSRDEEGMELPDAEAAHDMALGALVDAARNAVIEGSIDQHYTVEVRNGTGRVLEVAAVFSSKSFRRQ